MARSKIVFPSREPAFDVQIPVRITDLNYGNHVGNDSLLSIIHEARVSYLGAQDMSELDAGGTALIMGESLVIYKGEGFYGDVFTVEIWVDDITTATFDLLYKITTQRNEKIVTIAQAKTVMICFDYQFRKAKPISSKLLNVLQP